MRWSTPLRQGQPAQRSPQDPETERAVPGLYQDHHGGEPVSAEKRTDRERLTATTEDLATAIGIMFESNCAESGRAGRAAQAVFTNP